MCFFVTKLLVFGTNFGENGNKKRKSFRLPSIVYFANSLLFPTCKQRVNVGDFRAVHVVQIFDADFVVFLGEGVRSIFGNNHVVAELVSVCAGVTYAHVSVKTCHDYGVNAEFSQQQVEIGVEKSAVTAFGYNVVDV